MKDQMIKVRIKSSDAWILKCMAKKHNFESFSSFVRHVLREYVKSHTRKG